MLTNGYAIAAGVVIAVGVGLVEVHRGSGGWPVLARGALVLWVALVVGWTLFPLPVSAHTISVLREGFEGPPIVNLIPFRSIVGGLSGADGPQQPPFIVGNLVAFVPLGALLRLLAPRTGSVRAALVIGIVVSVAIEAAQWALSTAYGFAWRTFDVDDVILNSAGTLVGYVTAGPLLGGRRATTGTRRSGPR